MVQELKDARDDLEQATKTAEDDVREDIRETADSFRDYTVGDHEPDHAILDQHLNTLRQVRERASGDTKDKVESALETTESYREEVDQA
ncbi:hypothetical protein GS429_11140 [Natronorubrum sp. JWXQ-INN-674]|uniref:Uncharacterized protein n=1 Tax=Natronorubrum halalkaliphilum TaxID=2691917 RepID=A0A6B0VQ52_9EURY|nr:hypothetical protein [Natronorubrum halalkaliphilum]MXV62609.1 hypothetical protein [Natronorubrum halalkaliphilum]